MVKIRKAKAYNELESAWIQKDSKNMSSINCMFEENIKIKVLSKVGKKTNIRLKRQKLLSQTVDFLISFKKLIVTCVFNQGIWSKAWISKGYTNWSYVQGIICIWSVMHYPTRFFLKGPSDVGSVPRFPPHTVDKSSQDRTMCVHTRGEDQQLPLYRLRIQKACLNGSHAT